MLPIYQFILEAIQYNNTCVTWSMCVSYFFYNNMKDLLIIIIVLSLVNVCLLVLCLKHIGRERHASDKRHASRVIRVSNHFSSFHIA